MRHTKTLLIPTFLLLSVLMVLNAEAQNTVIKAGHLFDSRKGEILHDQTIVIRKNKILRIGKNLKYSTADKVIDLSDSWVLPGLMDCHVHITANDAYRESNSSVRLSCMSESSGFRALRGAFIAEQFLMSGFTTIKEIGNDANYATADVIKAIKAGWVKGPEIFYAGKIIAPYGGQSHGVNIENEKIWELEYIDADTRDEIIKAVRKNIYYGANVIKLVSGENAYYSLEDIQAAVNEAKKSGLKVSAHVMGGEAARNVIMGGVASVEHGDALDDELLRLMKEKGTFLVGTDFAFGNWYAYGMDSANADRLTEGLTDRLRRAYKIGTKMAFGTDIIIDIPGLNHVESGLKVLQTWKDAGIPSAYILQCMTIYAAELLGIEKHKGVLEQSYTADIIALKQNPLEDIDAVKKIHFVMRNGEVVKQEK